MNTTHQPPAALRVLLVEDNAFDVLMAERILRRAEIPCIITHVDRLTAGVEKALEGTDLVLLDLHLPDANRYEALAAVGRFRVPVIIFTGDPSPLRTYEAGRAGAVAALSKFSAHTELLPTILFACGVCHASGTLPTNVAEAIEKAYR